jgi:phosphatidylserine/phosphatidylglycerophosphate/cardiolipin synthase-like enzyme
MILDENEGNKETKEYLERVAQKNGWDLKVRTMKNVHTKGIVSEDLVLISSVNMNEESVLMNRETGVILYGEPTKFFRNIFEKDWKEAEKSSPNPFFEVSLGVLTDSTCKTIS